MKPNENQRRWYSISMFVVSMALLMAAIELIIPKFQFFNGGYLTKLFAATLFYAWGTFTSAGIQQRPDGVSAGAELMLYQEATIKICIGRDEHGAWCYYCKATAAPGMELQHMVGTPGIPDCLVPRIVLAGMKYR